MSSEISTEVTRSPVELAQPILDAIRRHGSEAYPHECCGALIGLGDRVIESLALSNTTEEGPRRRFLIHPEDYQAAEARAAATECELMGFYHSHPDHPALPSRYDLEHAWPFFAYIILSVRKGNPAELTAWRMLDDRSAFGAVELIGGALGHHGR